MPNSASSLATKNRSRNWADKVSDSLHGKVLVSIGVRVIGAGLAFAANVYLARLLGVGNYGHYMALLSAALLLGAFAVGGTNTVLVKEIAGGNRVENRAMVLWLFRRVGVAIVLAIGAYLVWTSISGASMVSVTTVDVGVVAVIILCTILTIQAGALNGLMATIRSQMLPLAIKNVALLAGVVFCAYAIKTSLSVSQALGLQAASYGIAVACGLAWIGPRWKVRMMQGAVRGTVNLTNTKSWSKMASHFLLMTVAATLINRFDVILVAGLSNDNVAGVYAGGARLAQIGLMVALALNTVLAPRFAGAWARNEWGDAKRLFKGALTMTVPVAAGEVIFAMFGAHYVAALLGPGYSNSAEVFVWTMVAYALWTLTAPAVALLTMTGSERTILLASWMILLVNCAAICLLVPRYGAMGGALGMTAGYFVTLPILVIQSIKKLRSVRASHRSS